MTLLRKLSLPLVLLLLLATGCGSDDDQMQEVTEPTASFDRGALLAFYADQEIIPAYVGLTNLLDRLETEINEWQSAPAADREQAFSDVQLAYYFANDGWQDLSARTTTVGEELNLQLRLNTYPTDTEGLDEAATAGTFPDLSLPSNYDLQGFPAMEYYLFEREDAASTLLLLNEARSLLLTARDRWDQRRDAFVANDGNSATASLDRMVNDYLFNYERFTRAGKVGIPAGVFSNTPLPGNAEAPFSGISTEALRDAFVATEQVFDSYKTDDHDLAAYLDALDVRRDGRLLSEIINEQFAATNRAVFALDRPIQDLAENDPDRLLDVYDEMQRLLVLLKIDMLQALSINVDYVDADGD